MTATTNASGSKRLRTPVRVEFQISAKAHGTQAVTGAGNAAFGLFVLCGSATARGPQPGHVSEYLARSYCDTKQWKRSARRLVEAGLWTPVPGGWEMVPKPRGHVRNVFRFVPVYKREPITDHLRARVMERDGHACVTCGQTVDLTLDHIHPWSLGGPDTFENLRVLCRPCNSRKGAKV